MVILSLQNAMEVVLINSELLKARVKKEGLSLRDLADLMEVSLATLKKRIDGRAEFTYQDIRLIASVLSLDGKEILNIFFDEKVS